MPYILDTPDGIDAMLPDLFKYLHRMPSEWPVPRLFIDGEFDSNQSDFEFLSNQGRIGVIASSEKAGHVLLLLLRIIIDDRPDRFGTIFTAEYQDHISGEDENTPKQLQTMEDIVNYLATFETEYTTIYELKKPIEVKLCGETIRPRLDQIDIWTLPRIRAEMLGLAVGEIRKEVREGPEDDDEGDEEEQ